MIDENKIKTIIKKELTAMCKKHNLDKLKTPHTCEYCKNKKSKFCEICMHNESLGDFFIAFCDDKE